MSYCQTCDDYGHSDLDHQKRMISWSMFRRLKVVKGDNWWINENAPPNGIGPVCLFCDKLIDWAPTDHGDDCPVRKFLGFIQEEEE